ncbi:hypothetical protein CDAR_265471 [Caerostris darwini]|uniref:Uncharacterized protein n=1 Tax=Caerostris darwini TaxID=1538125 RepID=A0AAV4RB09_9ARAC|nr:hypothetical protein CDAR_265471 [Caerostris darwini]
MENASAVEIKSRWHMVGSRVHSDVICGARANGMSVSGALSFCVFHNWDNSLRRRPQHKCALTCMLAVFGRWLLQGERRAPCLAQPFTPLLVTVSSFCECCSCLCRECESAAHCRRWRIAQRLSEERR